MNKQKHCRQFPQNEQFLKFLSVKKSQLLFMFYLKNIKFFMGLRSPRPVHLIFF